jgi:hypothetical protein
MGIVSFLRNRWFRVTLTTTLIIWSAASVIWLLTNPVPEWVVLQGVYDLITEAIIVVSLWLDVIYYKLKK